MKCKNCQEKEATKYSRWTSGEFCSKHCAKQYCSMIKREEINKKLSEKLKGQKATGKPFQKGWNKKFPEMLRKRLETVKKNHDLKVKTTPFELLSDLFKRERLLIEQNNKCALCDNELIWNGKPLVFQKDHINGNHKDERRENLRMICPNCHSQTNTFGVKNASTEGKKKMGWAKGKKRDSNNKVLN